MIFNTHSKLKDMHAFLGASKYHWTNYDDEKLINTYSRQQAAALGTRYHELAKECILLGVNLPRNKKTLNAYVNDAIGFKMSPEVILFYSEHCFGTADAISFRNNKLRVHDLKTGETRAHFEQLLIYNALFCLEYHMDPYKIEIENRIYQYDDCYIDQPDPDDVKKIMDQIIHSSKLLTDLKLREVGL